MLIYVLSDYSDPDEYEYHPASLPEVTVDDWRDAEKLTYLKSVTEEVW